METPNINIMSEKIIKGGVYYNIQGSNMKEVLLSVSKLIQLPTTIKKEKLYDAMIEREEVMSTAIGDGIALPHPRNTLLTKQEEEQISVCYLDKPICVEAPDGQPIYVLFIVLSSSLGNHLQMLSQLTYLFQKKEIQNLLKTKPDANQLIEAFKAFSK